MTPEAGQSVSRPDGAALLVNDDPNVGLLAGDKRVSIGLKVLLEAVHAGGDAPQGGDGGLSLWEIEARSLGALTRGRRHGRAGPVGILSKRLHQPLSYFCQPSLIEDFEHRSVMSAQSWCLAQRVFANAGDALGSDFRPAVEQSAARRIDVREDKVHVSTAGRRCPIFSMANRNPGPLALPIEFEPGPVRTGQ